MKSFRPASFSCLVALSVLALGGGSAVAQTTLNWRSESLNGNWNDANNWWNGAATQAPGGSEILRFGNAVQTTMANNLTGTASNRFQIYFDSGSGARTISGTTPNPFFDFSGGTPLIQNDSGNAQAVNFPVVVANAAGSSMDLKANSGTLTLGGAVWADGGTRTLYPQGAANIILSGVLSNGVGAAVLALNKPSGVGDLKLSGLSTYTGGTTISAGSVTIDSAGTYSSGITASATGKGNVTIADGVSIGAGSGRTWFVPTLTLQGTTTLTTANRLNVGVSTIDLSSGTRIVNVNGKSGTISTSGGTSTITGNSENTGLCQWEINNNTSGTTAPNSLTVQNGTLDLEANGSTWTGGNGGTYGMFRINGSGTTSFTGNGSLIVGNKVAFWVNNSFVAANAPALTISSGGYLNALDNDLTVYSLAGGGTYSLSLVTANSSTLSSTKTLTINGSAGSTDFSGTLQNGPGAGAELKVTKSAASTQTLSGANTYSGLTTVSGGTLKTGSATALGAGTSSALRNGSTTTTAGPGSTTVSSGAVLDLNGQTIASEALSLAGTGISSGGAVVNSAAGAASISGGAVNAVTLTASGTWTTGTLSGPPAVTVNNTGTGGSGLAMTAVVGLASITTAGGSLYTTAPTVTISGGGGTGLQINTSLSSGVVQFLIVNPGSGYTSLPTLGLTGGAGGSGASISAAAIGVVALNVSSFGSGYTSAPTISINNTSWASGATATATVPGVTLSAATSIGGTGDITIGQPISGAAALTKVGANTLTLSGANSFTGDTTLSAGTLRLGAGGVIPDGSGKGNVVLNPASGTATFDVNGQTETVNGLSNSGAGASVVDNSTGTGSLTVGGNGVAVTFTGVIQNSAGTLALTKTGAGTMTLSGASTYSGGTTISGGTALAGVSSVTSGTSVTSGPFGTGNLTLNDGVTLASSTSGGRSIAAPVINIAGNITLGQASGGTGRLSIDGTWDLGGASRTVTLGKASSGFASGLEVFRFEQLSGFTTPTVHNGSLVLATTTGSTATPSIARVLNTTSFSNNTALTLGDGVAMTSGGGVFFGTGANAPALTLNADAGRGGGVFQMGDGTSGGNSVMRLAEIYSLAGGGTVSAANSSGTTTTGTLTINNGNGATFSGAITEAGGTGKIALVKSGAGTQTFSGSAGHSGNTTISGGTLALGGSATMASTPVITLLSNATFNVAGLSSAFTLGSGQTLKGNGNVTGASVLNGSLEPGTSIGTLNFSAPPTLAGTTVMEINQSGAQTADNISVGAGTLNYGGALTVTNIGPIVTNGTFTLFTAPAYGGAFSSITLPVGGTNHWLTNNLAVNGTVTFTNNNPVASALTAGVVLGGSVTLPVIGGKNGATDADADVLTVSAVGTPTSGSASFTASNITYTATGSTGTNTFTYTVTDEVGATGSNTVTMIVSDPQGFNQVSAGVDGGNAVLTYLGIPGTNYSLEITHNLPATNWAPVITNPASASGFLYFTNPISLAPTNDYYRTRYVP